MQTTNQMAFPSVFKRRNFSISVNDALIDPNLLKPNQRQQGHGTITLKPNNQRFNAPKDPGYLADSKRSQEKHDVWSKTHFDYQGNPIMKLHDDDRMGGNLMSSSFYHEFSPNKKRTNQARYFQENSPQNQARNLAQKMQRYTGNKISGTTRSNSMHFERLTNALQAANLVKSANKAPQLQSHYFKKDDQSVATCDLQDRKMKLMKLMLTNERKANDMIKEKIKSFQQNGGAPGGLHTSKSSAGGLYQRGF